MPDSLSAAIRRMRDYRDSLELGDIIDDESGFSADDIDEILEALDRDDDDD